MTLMQFLSMMGVDWTQFSKNRQQYIRRWTQWDSEFRITGRGQDSHVHIGDPQVFRFARHAQIHWGIDRNINYNILYNIYKEVQRKQGRTMQSMMRLAAQNGVHTNTISSYIALLVERGLVTKHIWSPAVGQKRIRLKPQFHERFEIKQESTMR